MFYNLVTQDLHKYISGFTKSLIFLQSHTAGSFRSILELEHGREAIKILLEWVWSRRIASTKRRIIHVILYMDFYYLPTTCSLSVSDKTVVDLRLYRVPTCKPKDYILSIEF